MVVTQQSLSNSRYPTVVTQWSLPNSRYPTVITQQSLPNGHYPTVVTQQSLPNSRYPTGLNKIDVLKKEKPLSFFYWQQRYIISKIHYVIIFVF